MYCTNLRKRIRVCNPVWVLWGKRVVVVAPHPDDEVIGAGAHLSSMRDVWVVHATDGAPRNMRDAMALGFATRDDYARARHREAVCALRLAGIGAERCLHLDFPDQDSARQMTQIIRRLVSLFRGIRPDTVLTPPYEGGHPDHDAVALCVHTAARLAGAELGRPPRLIEYALYHRWQGRMRIGEFLPREGAQVTQLPLDPDAKVLKCRMLACYATQQKTLAQFPTDVERFRPAPVYDFTMPPHEGKLHYEHYDWGIMGHEWRRHAREVLRSLEAHAS